MADIIYRDVAAWKRPPASVARKNVFQAPDKPELKADLPSHEPREIGWCFNWGAWGMVGYFVGFPLTVVGLGLYRFGQFYDIWSFHLFP